jgi:hypothetical protein
MMNRVVFLHFSRLNCRFLNFGEFVQKFETFEFLQFSHAVDA